MYTVSFPKLGLDFTMNPTAFSIGNVHIAWYGIIIAVGILLAMFMAFKNCKRFGVNSDKLVDVVLGGLIGGVVGARLYYVAFSWSDYKDNLSSIWHTWEGGMAIYGGVIGAFLVGMIVARCHKMRVLPVLDVAALGFLIGQGIGRWGNFFNREAFGGYTDSLLAMQLPVSAVRSSDISADLAAHIMNVGGIDYIQVHPTFLYESLWNLCLLIFLIWYSNRKKFNGEVFLLYLFGYGIGRFWIEGLRTDQLILFGTGLPVSQLLAAVMAVAAAAIILLGRKKAASVSSQETNKAEKSE